LCGCGDDQMEHVEAGIFDQNCRQAQGEFAT